MLRPGGYFVSVDPDPIKSAGQRGTVEKDTSTCQHCGRVTFLGPRELPTRCFGCDGYICDSPECNDGCDVIERKLERMEASGRLMRDMGLG